MVDVLFEAEDYFVFGVGLVEVAEVGGFEEQGQVVDYCVEVQVVVVGVARHREVILHLPPPRAEHNDILRLIGLPLQPPHNLIGR